MASPHQSPQVEGVQGREFRPASIQELSDAIEQAFDYRGDITLELRSGRRVEGYLFNRSTGANASIEVLPANGGAVETFAIADIVMIAFTGEDTASGKSWETWVSKKASQRQAEAAQIAAEAQTRGLL